MICTPKRPRDTNQLAKMVVDIASGEKIEKKRSSENTSFDDVKNITPKLKSTEKEAKE